MLDHPLATQRTAHLPGQHLMRHSAACVQPKRWNQNPKPFTWRKTADDILDTLAQYLQRIPHSPH